jgi:UDP-N-acetylmuramate--alanine ligase
VLSEVYPAGEAPIAGADSHALARAIRARGRSEPVVVGKAAELASVLPDVLQDGDLLLMMGPATSAPWLPNRGGRLQGEGEA